ncbi:MAG: nickel-dependent lactate racemase [Candidatus Eisenbacteria bacterium]|nr:nickel-dependent lactate racemase [Candidatus Eisenbacteria bacterium]
MRFEVAYGDGVQSAEVPDERLAAVLEPADVPSRPESDVLDEALAEPVNGERLESFLEGASSVLVVVNDATRPTPTARLLKHLAPALRGLEITVAVATGTHRAPTDVELRAILGDPPPVEVAHVHIHDARDGAAHTRLAETKSGTPVVIDRVVLDAERVVVLSSVEPHYFAGYTGGRKSLIPGLAAFETVEANHAHAMSDRAQPLRLDGNPVHDDMVEAVDSILDRRYYAIMTVLDRGGRINATAAGDLHGTLRAVAPAAEAVYAPPIERRERIVVAAVSPPLHINLYQAQKALEHGILALEDGGTLILVSPCSEGLGDDTFARALRGAGTPEEAIDALPETYRFGDHKVARIARAVGRFDIVAVTGLARDLVASLFMLPAPDLQSAVDAALRKHAGGRVLVIPRAAETVPRLR